MPVTIKEARRVFEPPVIMRALEACKGSISQAAKRLGWSRHTLLKHLRAYGIRLDEHKRPYRE